MINTNDKKARFLSASMVYGGLRGGGAVDPVFHWILEISICVASNVYDVRRNVFCAGGCQ